MRCAHSRCLRVTPLIAAAGVLFAATGQASASSVGWHAVTVPIATGCSLNAASRVPGRSTFWVVGGCGDATAIALRHTRRGWRDNPPQRIIGYRDATLLGVDARSPGDAWAVGAEQLRDERHGMSAMLQRWNGISWEGVDAPQPGHEFTSRRVLRGVAAVDAASVWAVGGYRPVAGKPYRVFAEHWDGTAWHVANPPTVGHRGSQLYGIAVVPHTRSFYAFGWYEVKGGTHRPLVLRRRRGRWIVEKPPTAGPGSEPLYAGVVTDHGRTVWAVGRHVVERRTSDGWTTIAVTPAAADLRAITTVPGTRQLWAVGTGAGSNQQDALAERFDGSAWQAFPLSHRETLTGVAATGVDNVWAVGANGRQAEHYH